MDGRSDAFRRAGRVLERKLGHAGVESAAFKCIAAAALPTAGSGRRRRRYRSPGRDVLFLHSNQVRAAQHAMMVLVVPGHASNVFILPEWPEITTALNVASAHDASFHSTSCLDVVHAGRECWAGSE